MHARCRLVQHVSAVWHSGVKSKRQLDVGVENEGRASGSSLLTASLAHCLPQQHKQQPAAVDPSNMHHCTSLLRGALRW
eukprot:COSAG02_NODE_2607_length_8436_cov_3.451841_13_plen_79_part_00